MVNFKLEPTKLKLVTSGRGKPPLAVEPLLTQFAPFKRVELEVTELVLLSIKSIELRRLLVKVFCETTAKAEAPINTPAPLLLLKLLEEMVLAAVEVVVMPLPLSATVLALVPEIAFLVMVLPPPAKNIPAEESAAPLPAEII